MELICRRVYNRFGVPPKLRQEYWPRMLRRASGVSNPYARCFGCRRFAGNLARAVERRGLRSRIRRRLRHSAMSVENLRQLGDCLCNCGRLCHCHKPVMQSWLRSPVQISDCKAAGIFDDECAFACFNSPGTWESAQGHAGSPLLPLSPPFRARQARNDRHRSLARRRDRQG